MAILVAGTASGVGKNTISSALIRLMSETGLSPVPFKPLSIECVPVESGGEITPSIQLQSQAAGIEPDHDFNPIRVIFSATDDSADYYMSGSLVDGRETCIDGMGPHIAVCFEKAQTHGLVVVEGTGALVDAYGSQVLHPLIEKEVTSIILVADAMNGGSIASIVGTLELAPPGWLSRIKAIVINRFAGLPWDEPIPSWTSLLRERYHVPVVVCMPNIYPLSALSEDNWPMQSLEDIEADIVRVAETFRSRLGGELESILSSYR